MLAPAAAGSVLGMGGIVHRMNVSGFFIFRNVFVFAVGSLLDCGLLPDDRLCSGSNGPDETQ